MNSKLSDTLLSQLGEFVGEHLGLHFPRERWPDLERGVCAASQEHGHHDITDYVQELLSSTLPLRRLEVLASHLTVGETYFFREKQSLDILKDKIIPDLIRTRRGRVQQLRIWTAGCATGEESYSVAILLSSVIPDLTDWNVSILATDLNTRSLEKASQGVYGEWSFRSTPPWVRSGYFTPTADGRWAIGPAIKKMVTFGYLNLVADCYPWLPNSTNAMDVIFCRNVLMYFTPQAMKSVVHRFHGCLADGGWLIVSPTETSSVLFSEFVTVGFGETTLYRKTSKCPEAVGSFYSAGRREIARYRQPPRAMMESQESAETPALEIGSRSSASAGQPSSAEPLAVSYAEALRLYERGRYKDSEEMTMALLSPGQGNEQAILLLARLYANQGRLQEALQWCEKAIAANRMDARAHYLCANILEEQGSLEEAALSLGHAIYVDPQFVLGHFALGNLALRQGKLKESRKHFENALTLLDGYQQGDIVPESEGLTAGRLRDLIALQSDPNTGATHSRRQAARAPFVGAREYP